MGKAPLFGVYIHWPFCASKCPYCDFNSHVNDSIDHALWCVSLLKEIDYYAPLTSERTVSSIFFGGGTPSLMAPKTVGAIIDRIQKNWHISNDCEITLEANPTSVEADKFKAFRQVGVNRVSLGVQALNDDDLKFLGRKHSVKEAMKALEIAGENFERFSFDLIYARPEQSAEDWREELGKALQYSRGHMSVYQLTIEQGTPFYMQHQRGEFKVPDNDVAGELFEITQDIMNEAGMPAYEVSNHAVAGDESRHNMTYWRYDDYVGIGPGAHGRLTLNGKKQATRGHRAPDIWLERVAAQGYGGHAFEEVSNEQRFTEALMMGLRLREGVSLARLSEEAGKPWGECLDRSKVQAVLDEGMLVLTDDRLSATSAGLQRLNGVLGYLV